MFWIWIIIAVLVIPGLHGDAEVFSFDVSPLFIKECSGRPPNNCGPRLIRESDCAFLEPLGGRDKLLAELDDKSDNSSVKNAREAETYITLHCDFGHSENPTKEDLKAQVRAIRKKSPKRAIQLSFQSDALLDPEIFVPVSHQIAVFSLLSCTDSTVTSRLPSLNFTNLVDFAMEACQVAIRIRKADFSYLQKIRFIHFDSIRFDSIEPGTFTDLPDLTTFLIKDYDNLENVREAMDRLRCNAQFDWLWDWLDGHPDLRRPRRMGEVYKIGSLESVETVDITTRRRCTKVRNSTSSEMVVVQLQLT